MVWSACCLLRLKGADGWCEHLVSSKLRVLHHLRSGTWHALLQVHGTLLLTVADISNEMMLCLGTDVTGGGHLPFSMLTPGG